MQHIDIKQARRQHLGRYFYELNRFYQKITIAQIQASGFPEFTPGYLQFLSQVDIESGTEMKSLIKRLNTSKQLVSRTLKMCESLGYIALEHSLEDKRALVVKFDLKGKKLMKIAVKAIDVAEEKFQAEIGKKKFLVLKELLREASEKFDLIQVDSVS